MKGKLRDSRGETLVEVLASIVIAALSIALLFSTIMASTGMDRGARGADASYYQTLNAAEVQDGTEWRRVSVTVAREGASGASRTYDLPCYGGETARSYKYEEGS